MPSAAEQTARLTRGFPRIALPKGMNVTWHGAELELSSRVKTLAIGGLFITAKNAPPVGTTLRLAFDVPGEGFGLEFTRMDLRDKLLLQRLLNRLLQ